MCIHIADGTYTVMTEEHINAVFDNLIDAITHVRNSGKVPHFTW